MDIELIRNASSFNGQEYLGLYPHLEYAQILGTNRYDFWVFDQIDREKNTTLRKWLNGNDYTTH